MAVIKDDQYRQTIFEMAQEDTPARLQKEIDYLDRKIGKAWWYPKDTMMGHKEMLQDAMRLQNTWPAQSVPGYMPNLSVMPFMKDAFYTQQVSEQARLNTPHRLQEDIKKIDEKLDQSFFSRCADKFRAFPVLGAIAPCLTVLIGVGLAAPAAPFLLGAIGMIGLSHIGIAAAKAHDEGLDLKQEKEIKQDALHYHSLYEQQWQSDQRYQNNPSCNHNRPGALQNAPGLRQDFAATVLPQQQQVPGYAPAITPAYGYHTPK